MASNETTQFKVTDKETGAIIKVATIDPTKHNHVSGVAFDKATIDSIKDVYGAAAVVSSKKD